MAEVLVTGADGVVGNALVRALLARGDAVTLLRRPGGVRRSALALDGTDRACAVVEGDMRDAASLARAFGERRPEAVFHLAAQSIVSTAQSSPAETFATNITGTWQLLEACRAHDVGRVVVASSDKAYGPAGTRPSTENDPLRPRFPYDVSKACADLITRSYFHTYGLATAVARLPNAYGAGDSTPSRLIPELIGAVLAGRAPVIRTDGSPRREFLHAEDAAGAYLAIGDALTAGTARGEAFNAGEGRSHSVREVVELLVALSGADVAPVYGSSGSPEGEIAVAHVDSGKLAATTGWAPRVTLEDGLARTLAWYREHPDFLRG